MRRSYAFWFALVGTVAVLTGVFVAALTWARRDACFGVSPSVVCQGYTTTIRWAVLIIAIGTAFFLMAGLVGIIQARRSGRTPT